MCKDLYSRMGDVWRPEGDNAIGVTEVQYRIVFILCECMTCPELGSMLSNDLTCGGVLIF